MTTTKTLTLGEYADDRGHIVLFFAGVGTPAGDYALLGCPDDDFAESRGLLDLSGEIDEAGDWRWNGVGDPTDGRGNTIYKLHAYADARKWESLAAG